MQVHTVAITNTQQHTYHSLDEYTDLQTRQREVRAKAELEQVFDAVELRVQRMCKEVQKQARLYQESVRSKAELEDSTGVELFQSRSSGKHSSMVHIKKEKIDRALTYRSVTSFSESHLNVFGIQ